MRKSFIALLIFTGAWSTTIDTNLYEAPDKEVYYQKIEKSIDHAERNHLRSKEAIAEERHQLSRLRSAASQKLQIDTYDLKALKQKKIPLDLFYLELTHLSSLHAKLDQYRHILEELRLKIIFFKDAIENVTKEKKSQLLSFQLQFAYYKLQQKHIEAKMAMIQDYALKMTSAITQGIPAIDCEKMDHLLKTINALQLSSGERYKEKLSLELIMEKAKIDDSKKISLIQKDIHSKNLRYQQEMKSLSEAQIQYALCLLKQKEDDLFFTTIEQIESNTKHLSLEDQRLLAQQTLILKGLVKDLLGSGKLFFKSTLFESKEIVEKFLAFFSSTLFVFNERSISPISIFKVILFIILGFLIGIFYKRWVTRLAKKWPDMSQMSIRLASNIGYYLIIISAFIIAASSIGVDMSSISLIAGALSIGIGFGLQTVVSNFIAGIILMFERTIRIGDTIEISDLFRGRVTDIRIRSTTIKTFDNIDIVVPNSSFIKDNVINWTLEDPNRRLHIPFSVAYGTKVEDVKKAIFEELDKTDLKYIRDSSIMSPEIWMTTMNNSSVDFELLVWVEWSNKLRSNSMQSDFLILIYNALNKHEIKIPFPQLDLYVKQLPS